MEYCWEIFVFRRKSIIISAWLSDASCEVWGTMRCDILLPAQWWDAVRLTKTDVMWESLCSGGPRQGSSSWSNERVLLSLRFVICYLMFDAVTPCWQYEGCELPEVPVLIPSVISPCCRPARLTRPLQLYSSAQLSPHFTSQFSISACQGWRVTAASANNSNRATTSRHCNSSQSWHCWKQQQQQQKTKTGQ